MAEKLAPNFVDDEFRCKHCGKLPEKGMKTLLIVLLQLLRNKVGKPLVITSGYRCPTHNKLLEEHRTASICTELLRMLRFLKE